MGIESILDLLESSRKTGMSISPEIREREYQRVQRLDRNLMKDDANYGGYCGDCDCGGYCIDSECD